MEQTELFGDSDSIDLREIESVTVFDVRPTSRISIRDFVEKWHYSHNINGLKHKYCFGLYYGEYLIGAAIFGPPATPGVAEAYSEGGTLNVVELRRLCCIDNTPRNTESYFIGCMIRWLRNNTDEDVILSYSDKTYGHEGTIYKATNFQLIGESPAVDKILHEGKLYHDKALRVYNGSKANGAKQKPFSVKLAEALREGRATRVSTKPKNIYILKLRKKKGVQDGKSKRKQTSVVRLSG